MKFSFLKQIARMLIFSIFLTGLPTDLQAARAKAGAKTMAKVTDTPTPAQTAISDAASLTSAIGDTKTGAAAIFNTDQTNAIAAINDASASGTAAIASAVNTWQNKINSDYQTNIVTSTAPYAIALAAANADVVALAKDTVDTASDITKAQDVLTTALNAANKAFPTGFTLANANTAPYSTGVPGIAIAAIKAAAAAIQTAITNSPLQKTITNLNNEVKKATSLVKQAQAAAITAINSAANNAIDTACNNGIASINTIAVEVTLAPDYKQALDDAKNLAANSQSSDPNYAVLTAAITAANTAFPMGITTLNATNSAPGGTYGSSVPGTAVTALFAAAVKAKTLTQQAIRDAKALTNAINNAAQIFVNDQTNAIATINSSNGPTAATATDTAETKIDNDYQTNIANPTSPYAVALAVAMADVTALASDTIDAASDVTAAQKVLAAAISAANKAFPAGFTIAEAATPTYANSVPGVAIAKINSAFAAQDTTKGGGDSDVVTLNSTGICVGCDLMNLQGITQLNPGLKIKDLTTADLKYANLSGWDLTDVDFTNADLTGATLSNCILNSAKFIGANLSGADLSGVTAIGTDFTSASLYSADMSKSNFTSAIFTGTGLAGANINSSNFSKATIISLLTAMDQASTQSKTIVNSKNVTITLKPRTGEKVLYLDLRGQTLNNVNFNSANLEGINLSNCVLNNVDFTGADVSATADLTNVNTPNVLATNNTTLIPQAIILNGTNFTNSTLEGVDFTQNIAISGGVDFTGANLTSTNWVNTTTKDSIITQAMFANGVIKSFVGANFTNAILAGSVFRGANLTGLDLDHTNFTNANLYGATIFASTANKSIFTNANIANAIFLAGNIDSATFDNANLSQSSIVIVNFTKNSFQNVTLDNSNGFIINSDTSNNTTGTNVPASSGFPLNLINGCLSTPTDRLNCVRGAGAINNVNATGNIDLTSMTWLNNLIMQSFASSSMPIQPPYNLSNLLGNTNSYNLDPALAYVSQYYKGAVYLYFFAIWLTPTMLNNSANLLTFMDYIQMATNMSKPVPGVTKITFVEHINTYDVANFYKTPAASVPEMTCFDPYGKIISKIQTLGPILPSAYLNLSGQPAIACSCP